MTRSWPFVALATAAGRPAHRELSRALLLLVPGAIGIGLWPRTRWVTVCAVVTVCAWLVTTIRVRQAGGPARVALLAGASRDHAARRWLRCCPTTRGHLGAALGRPRVGVVAAAGLGVGLGGMALSSGLPDAQSIVGPIVGSVVAAGLAGLLAWHLLRR
jgi:hypothetical protein